jgi:hypothetical protein
MDRNALYKDIVEEIRSRCTARGSRLNHRTGEMESFYEISGSELELAHVIMDDIDEALI